MQTIRIDNQKTNLNNHKNVKEQQNFGISAPFDDFAGSSTSRLVKDVVDLGEDATRRIADAVKEVLPEDNPFAPLIARSEQLAK